MRQPFPPGPFQGCAPPACQNEGSPLAGGAGVSDSRRFASRCTPQGRARFYAEAIASHGTNP